MELSETRNITMIKAMDDANNQCVSTTSSCILGGTATNTIPTASHSLNEQQGGTLESDHIPPQDKEKTGCIPKSQWN
jgi:hypothetical protein